MCISKPKGKGSHKPYKLCQASRVLIYTSFSCGVNDFTLL